MRRHTLKRFILLVSLMALLAIPATSFAGKTWYTCSIVRAGMEGQDYVAYLTDTASSFSDQECKFANGYNRKGMLAVALTAVAAGKYVKVQLDDDNKVHSIYVVN